MKNGTDLVLLAEFIETRILDQRPMNISATEYDQLKEEVKELEEARAEARGVMRNIQQTLKQEYGVSSIKEAKQLLKDREDEETELRQEFEKRLEEFRRKLYDARAPQKAD
jgi:conjugal transfer/entry exclusion protein